MPFYRVWYRNNPEPMEFTSASRCRDEDILDRVLEHEQLAPPDGALAAGTGNAPTRAPALRDLIAMHHLAPVRYTEDEGEMQSIR